MKDLNCGLLSAYDLTSESLCEKLFSPQNSIEFRDFLPQKYSDDESYSQNFDLNNAKKLWGKNVDSLDGFFWKNSTSHLDGFVHFSSKLGPSSLYMNSSSKKINTVRFVDYFKHIIVTLRPEFAYLHCFSETEFDLEPNNILVPVRRGVSVRTLQSGIPNLCWLTYFGPSYTERFSKKLLLSCPSHSSIETVAGRVVIQLTELLEDCQTNYEAFDKTRNTAKEYLGRDAFGLNANRTVNLKVNGVRLM